MKVLIIGSNGFIGKELCKGLQHYHSIIAIDRQKENLFEGIIDYRQLDITNFNAVSRVFSEFRPEVIVNCAAVISYDDSNKGLMDVNIRGLLNLITISQNVGIKQFVQFSSLPVIGTPTFLPIDENHPIYPSTFYHLTKYFGEILLSNAKFKSVNLRIPSPVGPGMPKDKILPVFIGKSLRNEDIILRGKGLRSQNYINVKDIIQGVILSIENQAAGVYNLASSQSISNVDLAQKCIALTESKSTIRFEGEDKEENNQWIVSIVKAQNELGFSPQFTIEDTIKELIESFDESIADK